MRPPAGSAPPGIPIRSPPASIDWSTRNAGAERVWRCPPTSGLPQGGPRAAGAGRPGPDRRGVAAARGLVSPLAGSGRRPAAAIRPGMGALERLPSLG